MTADIFPNTFSQKENGTPAPENPYDMAFQ
jgi:hypothetical protein